MIHKPYKLRKPGFSRRRLQEPWSETLTLSDGRELLLRPLRKSDAAALREGFKTLTPEEVRFRFLHPMSELTPARALSLADIDRRREFALALRESDAAGKRVTGAVARVAIDDTGREAEFAIIVASALGGHGLGTYMLRRLIEWCRRKRLQAIYGDVLVDNHAMLRVADHLGFRRLPRPDEPGMVRVYMPLGAAAREPRSKLDGPGRNRGPVVRKGRKERKGRSQRPRV
ncbi:MAG TPA: GNAT family N-acetyltransferase [Xanthomonadaceae bacterium]|nr:GNAT family N-acetyltransferase [Xanthomonadaceae bacterium]